MTKVLAVGIVLVIEAALSAQIRSGAIAESLSSDDVAEIGRQAASVGRSVWMLDGDASRVPPETWNVDAYLAPDLASGPVHRGRVLRLQSEIVNGKPVRWATCAATAPYARVPTASSSGRPPISSEGPFLLGGSFSDDELISLLTYIRTSPAPAAQTMREAVDGTLPIISVSRSGNEVLVGLRRSTSSGQTVRFIRERSEWVVVNVFSWVL